VLGSVSITIWKEVVSTVKKTNQRVSQEMGRFQISKFHRW